MKIDHCFRQGTTHKVCQDYVTSNQTRVVLSDGCSGSKHSDIGARALSHAALLQNSHLGEYTVNGMAVDSMKSIFSMGLKVEDCYSTMLYCDYDEYMQKIRTVIVGDGSFYIRYKNGKSDLYDIDYSDGYPYYVHYKGDAKAAYIKQGHGNYKLTIETEYDNGHKEVSVNNRSVKTPKYDGGLWATNYLELTNDASHIDFVALFSDGVKQIEGWDYKDVIKELVSFKNLSGQFVQRRVAACFKRHNWKNADDFSMGVLLNEGKNGHNQ